jgi:hypothetical protein
VSTRPGPAEEQPGGQHQHGQVDQTGQPHRDHHVEPLGAQQRLLLGRVGRRDPVLGERAVQVDDVRHDRGAQDPGGEQHAVDALEAGHQPAGHRAGVHPGDGRAEDEAERDDRRAARRRPARTAGSPALQGEQREGDDRGDQPAGQQRQAEQQVQRDGPADHLGQVGRHRDQLGLHPQARG